MLLGQKKDGEGEGGGERHGGIVNAARSEVVERRSLKNGNRSMGEKEHI